MKKIKIAVVDDHNLFRLGLISILNQVENFEVVLEATNGKEFLEKWPKQAVDVVLLDIQMPLMTGIELTEFIKKKDTDLKILILSMHDEDQYILHLMEIGANGYLLKDTDPEDVELAINKVYESGIYFSDFVGRVMLKRATLRQQKSGKIFNNKTDLSDREMEVIRHLCEGLTTAEIGEKMYISPRTVEGHKNRIMEKVGVNNTAKLVAYAIKNDLILI